MLFTANLPHLAVSHAPIRAAGLSDIHAALLMSTMMQQAPLFALSVAEYDSVKDHYGLIVVNVHEWNDPPNIFC